MKLAIISHTEHYRNPDGTIVGWGPTVSEINHLASDFEEIYHLAFLYHNSAPPSSLPYLHKNIHFVPLKPKGGKGFQSKLELVGSIPEILKIVRQTLKKVDFFQVRTPMGMGVFLIPYLTLFSNQKGWYKYAGNWNQENPPTAYALQRAMLKWQKRPVTINGKWPGQHRHCLTFENPCLAAAERREGSVRVLNKNFRAPFVFCFVGRLEDAKGVQRIIDAFESLHNFDEVLEVHFIGDGQKLDFYKEQCKNMGMPAIFHGFLAREGVFEIYRKSHFILLPTTASEGFPKVIAEAMNFGCIPIVSNVSSIAQYVNSENGFNVEPCTYEALAAVLEEATHTDAELLRKKNIQAHRAVFQFTFDYYRDRIQKEIIAKD